MKKNYNTVRLQLVGFIPESGILAGSQTDIEMKLNNVSVEDFADGFAEQGGFETINFD